MQRYYLGVDWADRSHQVYATDESGKKIKEIELQETPEGLAEFGRWVDESRGGAAEVWAAIEKPHGRIVDFLLDHGVVVYPVNPKALDRARDKFRMSQSKSDSFDAFVLADFLRTNHMHLRALEPDSAPSQELKMLTRDHQRLLRQKTRLVNQIKVTLKEYYPRALDLFDDLETKIAMDFIKTYPAPQALSNMTRKECKRFAKGSHHLSDARWRELWEKIDKPQLPIPEHVVRAKTKLLLALVVQLEGAVKAVNSYSREIQRFFADMPAAKIAKTLPGAKSGTTIAKVWAELGDAKNRWRSFRHLQAEAGTVPVTKTSGKSRVVQFRYACNKQLRYAIYWLAFNSRRQCEWANKYYRDQRAKGHSKHQALRALGAKWLKIIFVIWRDHKAYDENYHLANITRQTMRQAA